MEPLESHPRVAVVEHHELDVVARRTFSAIPHDVLDTRDGSGLLGQGGERHAGDHRATPTSGRYGVRSARSPLARSRPACSASDHVREPVARASQVSASVSTTAGGVPRVCRTPSTACTAAYGG